MSYIKPLQAPDLLDNTSFFVGRWRIEPQLNRIVCEDGEVTLVPKVMALLQVLVEHRGQPLSQERLIELVWPGQVVSDGSVYQAIAQLRKALGDSADRQEYIERVSGKGYRLVAEVKAVAAQKRGAAHRRSLVVALMLLATIFAIVLWQTNLKESAQAEPVGKIASLTLVDLTPQTAVKDDGLAGLTNVLLTELTHIDGLRVVHYRQMPDEVKTDALMSGSISRQGSRFQLFLQLQRASTAEVLWAKVFEGSVDDAYRIQSQVGEILPGLFGRRRSAGAFERPDIDARSFDDYLLARHLWDSRDVPSLHKAQAIFEQMQHKGKLFPLAAVGLCDTYLFLHIYSDWPLEKAMSRCDPLLDLALKEQPDLGEAVASKALMLSSQGKKEAAGKLFEKALALSPNYAFGLMWYGNLIRDLGQYDRALEMTHKAYDLAPMSPVINRSLAYSYLTLSRFSDARYYYLRSLTLDPNYFAKPAQTLDFLPLTADRANAFLTWRKANIQQVDRQLYYRMTHAQIELSLGHFGKAKAIFEHIDLAQINPAFVLYMKASFAAAQGDLDSAAELLRERMTYHPDKRRFIMPYLTVLYVQGKYDEVAKQLMTSVPELSDPAVKITADNQYLLAFFLYVQSQRGQAERYAELIHRMDRWFAEQKYYFDHYYVQWRVFRHDKAEQALRQLMDQGWLPDYNEDMLATPIIRRLFVEQGLGAETFDKLLEANRRKAMGQ